VTNKTDAQLRFRPDSLAVRAGNRLYHQSISDASGAVPPLGSSTVYFAVTGTPDGGRNELSLKNGFYRAGRTNRRQKTATNGGPDCPGAIAGAASVTYRRSQGLSNAQKTSPGGSRRR